MVGLIALIGGIWQSIFIYDKDPINLLSNIQEQGTKILSSRTVSLLIPGINRPFWEAVPLILALYVSLGVHELGHYVACRTLNVPVAGPTFSFLLGAALSIDKKAFEAKSIISQSAVVSAGIVYNVLLCMFLSYFSPQAFTILHLFFEKSPGPTIIWGSHALESIGVYAGVSIVQLNGIRIQNMSQLVNWLKDPRASIWQNANNSVSSPMVFCARWDQPFVSSLVLEHTTAVDIFRESRLSDYRLKLHFNSYAHALIGPVFMTMVLYSNQVFAAFRVYLYITSSALGFLNLLPLPLPKEPFGGASDGLRLVRLFFAFLQKHK